MLHHFGPHLTLEENAYFRLSQNLIDLGQFGFVPIFTPFNYKNGRIWGAESSAVYDWGNLFIKLVGSLGRYVRRDHPDRAAVGVRPRPQAWRACKLGWVSGVQIPSAPPSSLSIFGLVGESIEIGASARDLQSRTDPESASQVAIRRNQAKVIRARFCLVHLQDRRDEAEFMAGEM